MMRKGEEIDIFTDFKAAQGGGYEKSCKPCFVITVDEQASAKYPNSMDKDSLVLPKLREAAEKMCLDGILITQISTALTDGWKQGAERVNVTRTVKAKPLTLAR
ncbi:MAG: hypothetical protein H6853_06860 [Rhodospirillales bacterium]|nr:hypothetical protein [Alphaproteobacteria bacterium]USO03248.1 MAG: hypothetical protein H6853_06860 [Rhodospirillales bacterium]